MRRYWYYCFETDNRIGQGVDSSDSGEFDVYDVMTSLEEEYKGELVRFTYWHEISKTQYEKLCKLFDNPTK